MTIFSGFRKNLGNFSLTKRLKKLKREKKVFNFKSAKTAGIIFSANNESDWLENKLFIDFLKSQDIQLTILVYLKNKKLKNYYTHINKINYFSIEDLKWSYTPKPGFVNRFMEKDYDLLIDMDTEHSFPTAYITALSKAHFKVGLKNNEHNYFDLMIDLGNFKNKEEYFNQIKHYLSIINN
ncbi:MAG: hypothetical protein JXB17_08550 [Bacteroidales bacterium]|nr:hypothetical protein [Bacteroidales bacterium]